MSTKKGKSQERSKSKDQKKSQNHSFSQNCSSLEDFEDNILDVDLSKNRTARSLFVSEVFATEHKNERLMDAMPKISKKWASLGDAKRKKYEDMAAKEKERFDEHLALVRKHLLSKPLKENATAYYIYLDEAAKRAIDNLQDVKEARAAAREEWKNLSGKEKEKWEEKKAANHELYEKLKASKPGSVSAYALWVKDEIASAKEKGHQLSIAGCAEKWKKVKEETKDKYAEYAKELKEEKEKQRDLYEVTFGVKPRRPLGPYNYYLQEMAKMKKHQGPNFMKDCSKAWKKMSEDDKEKYERVAKRGRLVHMVKMMEWNNTKKSSAVKRAPSAYNLYVADMTEKLTDKDLNNKTAFEYVSTKWAKETDAVKKKYQKMSDQAKKDKEHEKEDYMKRVYENPKRAKSGYQIFLSERMPELKDKHSNLPTSEVFKKVASEWASMKEDKKEKYNQKAEPLREAYKEKMKEFERFGYYNPDAGNAKSKSAKKEKEPRSSTQKSQKRSSTQKSKSKSPAKKKSTKKN